MAQNLKVIDWKSIFNIFGTMKILYPHSDTWSNSVVNDQFLIISNVNINM